MEWYQVSWLITTSNDGDDVHHERVAPWPENRNMWYIPTPDSDRTGLVEAVRLPSDGSLRNFSRRR